MNILIGTTIAALVFGVSVAKEPAALEIGKGAPNFSLPDSNGKTHKLSDFAGKYVVLEWTNHQCPFVVKQYQGGDMQRQQKWAKEKGVVWLSIVSSAPGKQGFVSATEANAVMKEKGHSVAAMLLDPEGKVGKLYEAKTTPHMYVIDPKGKLIYMGAIDNMGRGGSGGAKVEYVIQALKESMAGKAVSVTASQPYGCSVKY